MKEYNLGADVFSDYDDKKIYGRVNQFKDVEEFKRYLAGEYYTDINKIKNEDIEIIYMRFLPKGNFYSDNEPCWYGCEKGKGASSFYKFKIEKEV